VESVKTLILNDKKNQFFKAVLNLRNSDKCQIKFFNLQEDKNKHFALGIKQNSGVVKVPLYLQENKCEFNLPKGINMEDKLLCAVVDVSNAFCPEIVLSGSLNLQTENDQIENAFVQTKPEDTSILYEQTTDEQIDKLIDENFKEDLNTNYYDNCSRCKYRQVFYNEGDGCCCSNKANDHNIDALNVTENLSQEGLNANLNPNNAQNKASDMQSHLKSSLSNKEEATIINSCEEQLEEVTNTYKNVALNEETLKEQDEVEQNKEENSSIAPGEEQTFYEQVKQQISALFEKYEVDETLQQIIPNSKWIKVDYERKQEYYVLGLIYDDNNQNVVYISYGIPSTNSKVPPEDLKDYAQWLPKDFSNPEQAGYWIVYQDAITGETIKIDFV